MVVLVLVLGCSSGFAQEFPESLKNSIGIELKLIPAGTFMMGQAEKGPGMFEGVENETPHQVTLSKPYYMGVTEVTNAQWEAVMGRITTTPSKWKDDNRPVMRVSWLEAVMFCRKISELPNERKAGRHYRLPTEAEWEYACRAGSKTKWSFGDNESKLGQYAWFLNNSSSPHPVGNWTPHPVGQKKPNAWGLFDMHGNAREWCSDWYDEYGQDAVTDPRGPSEDAVQRVVRGGGYGDMPWSCRSAARQRAEPTFGVRKDPTGADLSGMGFRLALSPSGAE